MNGYAYMAMTNYPYYSKFLEPMPAWPVNESCHFIMNATIPPIAVATTKTLWESLFTQEEKVEDNSNGELTPHEAGVFAAILNSTNVYYNYSG